MNNFMPDINWATIFSKSFFNYLLFEGKIKVSPINDIETPKLEKKLPEILTEDEITKLIKESIPDASIEIKDLMGDNNHYAATIVSSQFNNLSKIEIC